ncbi:MAG: hypothetical protein WBO84_11545, partial [Acidimicrobiia bacterium]
MSDESTSTPVPGSSQGTDAEVDEGGGRRGFPWKRIVQALVSLAIVAGIFFGVMPLIADYGDVFDTIRAMTSLEIGSLVAFGLW